jgi:hypothetical protein
MSLNCIHVIHDLCHGQHSCPVFVDVFVAVFVAVFVDVLLMYYSFSFFNL